MSRKFLTPVNLPKGNTLPSVGSAGDLFYKLDEQALYVHNGTAWAISQGGVGSFAELSDVELTNLANNQVAIYNSTSEKWVNVDTDVLTGTNYDVLDGGTAGSTYLVTVNGGGANG
jgi:hypothetical protein